MLDDRIRLSNVKLCNRRIKNKKTRLRQTLKKYEFVLFQLRDKIKALNSKSGQRDKINTTYGAWFATKKNGWVYGVCTNDNYPERHAFGLIGKIR